MKEYRVLIPDEYYQLVNFRQEDLPGVAVINSALQGFEPREVLDWHLSLMIDFEDLIENGMPSRAECELIEPWENELDAKFKGENPKKPNALFLARITWRETRELLYRVCQPDPPHEYLRGLIQAKEHLRPFDYRIDSDPEWALANWHLNTALNGEGGAQELS